MARLAVSSLTATIAFFAMAGVAHGQAIPGIEESITQGAQIEEAIGRTTRPGDPAAVEDEAIAGEAGIYILKTEDIFYVAANVGAGFSTNPVRTADNVGGSGLVEGSLSVGMRTRLANAFDFGIAANLEGTHYLEDFGPSNYVASGNVSVGTAIAGTPLYVGLAAFGGWNLDEDFKNPVSFYGASGHVSATIPINRYVALQPALAATRVWTEIKENDTKSVSARLAVSAGKGPVAATLFGAVSRIWFDDFYEDVTFVARNDWQYELGATVSYRLAANILLSANLRYTKRDSPFFLATYDSFDGGVAFAALWRF